MYLNALKDRAQGKDIESPEPPLAYTILVWRRKMHVGYFEAMRMPLEAILADLEMMDLEAEYGPKHAIMETKQE